MNIIADTHTHTLASTHAYSTVLENAKYASETGIKYLGVTDHAPKMKDAPHIWHFMNLHQIPDELFGVKILRGAEINILDTEANVDLPDDVLKDLDWIVCSFHPIERQFSKDELTKAYLKVAENPFVDVIGHSGRSGDYDHELCIKKFAENNKLVEINEASFFWEKTISACRDIALICKKLNCRICVNTDSHFAYKIGHVDKAFQLLNDIDFPKELIVNADIDRFENYLEERKKRINSIL